MYGQIMAASDWLHLFCTLDVLFNVLINAHKNQPYWISNLIKLCLSVLYFTSQFWKPQANICICDWACKNRVYLHKIHMFKNWYFSWSVLMIFTFCKPSLLPYWYVNKAQRFYCNSICTSKDIVSWILKIWPNFVCRYALFSQAWSHIYLHFIKYTQNFHLCYIYLLFLLLRLRLDQNSAYPSQLLN